jgi:cell fate (sporulation/competence/biofilm development) regulator YlbF (YheA/YmcA/DUF963 family)
MPLPAAHPAVGEPMSETINFPPELYQATESLYQNLVASRPFLAYHQSQEKMNSDLQARALMERMSTLQNELRRKQGSNSVTQADVAELRAVQDQVQVNAIIMDFARSQQEAVAFLREINQEISQLLGVDFAALAKQNSC